MNKSELNIMLNGNGSANNNQQLYPGVILRSTVAQQRDHSHIPVPRSGSAVNCIPSKFHPNVIGHAALRPSTSHQHQHQHPPVGKSMSVAAQRAAFEKLDAAAVASSSSPVKLVRASSTNSNSQTEIPSPVTCRSPRLDRSNSFQEASRWKAKFEEAEKRRKMLLQKSESVNRENADLEKKYQQLLRQNNTLQTQLQDKSEKLDKMRSVSEAVCKEYEQLKRQYDVETGAMHKAMQQASQWYQQNRELKRRSQVITQRYLQANPDALNDFDLQDEVDNHADDIEQLRETVTELSQEVAKLQTELSAARLQEFEAQEQVTHLTAQLEEERVARENEEENVRKIKTQKENMERVTKMVADEVQALKTQCDNERENARMAKIEADKIQKERNVLAHQSALLMVDVGNDPSGRLLVLLQEVETLKRTLEEEKQAHAAQIQVLQEKLEEKESNVEFEIVEEKLKLSEAELVMVEQRAERAENIAEAMKGRVRELELKVAELEKKASAPPPPPLPPPPPPPPMPTSSTNGSPSLKLITREKLSSETNNSAVENMENMLGINKKSPPMPQQPAIDDIINQIKGGRFTLKQTDKQREEERKRKQEEESKPPAVSEMLNILGTMRRRAKPTRNSIKFSNGPS
ncbi:shootin-1-like isoform X2 [Phymastichus coffea]|uniref:shootin-1-like isoform X2 n=1 Tax=Phymastichus coffea TaxID=108790 RepID=UPI00273B13BB|nr:shootin-1-like isoform X2 [Phymastichus coffea]